MHLHRLSNGLNKEESTIESRFTLLVKVQISCRADSGLSIVYRNATGKHVREASRGGGEGADARNRHQAVNPSATPSNDPFLAFAPTKLTAQ